MTTTKQRQRQQQQSPISSSSSFDYVIVGAGPSAMGLLLGLLLPFKDEEKVPFSIAVIERGDGDDDDDDDDDKYGLSRQQPTDWVRAPFQNNNKFVSLIESQIHGRNWNVSVGQGLGGTSNINATLCIPPAADDFDTWPAHPWKDRLFRSIPIVQSHLHRNGALSYFTCQRTDIPNNNTLPPASSVPTAENPLPWKVTRFPSLARHIPCMVGSNDDVGGDDDNNDDGRRRRRRRRRVVRKNYYDGLVAPILQKHAQFQDAVTWFCQHEAQRLLFSSGTSSKIEGVECSLLSLSASPSSSSSVTTAFIRIYARRDVVLCAGAIESPALLLTSGIGLPADLESAGIPCCRGVEESGFQGAVGHNLRDQVMLPRGIVLHPPITAPLSPPGVQAICQMATKNNKRFQFHLYDSQVSTHAIPRLLASLTNRRFTNTKGSRSKMLAAILNLLSRFVSFVLEFSLVLLHQYTPLRLMHRYLVSLVGIFLLNPSSVGKVSVYQKRGPLLSRKETVRRCDLDIHIELPYLNDERDVDAMMEGWIKSEGPEFPFKCTKLLSLPLMRWFRGGDRRRFRGFARSLCFPYFHWSSTCSMISESGNDEGWVVDKKLRVRQFSSLRVCDASVFPTTISSPPALTCAAMGHLLGSMLVEENKENYVG